MILTSILAVAIGLLFLWVVLSFATIQIQEWINTRLGKRAEMVETAILEMLANPNLKAQFYDHPVIRDLIAKTRMKPSSFHRYALRRNATSEKRSLPA
jgi:hypothetical protein